MAPASTPLSIWPAVSSRLSIIGAQIGPVEQFDLLLNTVSCPLTGTICNLYFDEGLTYFPAVDGILWQFKTRIAERKDTVTELWHLQHNGHRLDLVIKYSPNSDIRFGTSAQLVNTLNGLLKQKHPLLVSPRASRVQRIHEQIEGGTVPIILMPYVNGLTLKDYTIAFAERRNRIARYNIVLSSCLKALCQLHSVPIDSLSSLTVRNNIAGSIISCYNLQGSFLDRFFLKAFLKKVTKKKGGQLRREIEQVGISYIHGDCFPYNIVLDETGSVQLIDWESVQIGCPLQDISKLLASIVLAFIATGYHRRFLEYLSSAVDHFYGKALSKSLLFRIYLFRAIVRFSPLSRKYFVAVPVDIAKMHGYRKVLRPQYPSIVVNYYMFLWRFFRQSLALYKL